MADGDTINVDGRSLSTNEDAIKSRLRVQLAELPESHPDHSRVLLTAGEYLRSRPRPGRNRYRYQYVHMMSGQKLQVRWSNEGRRGKSRVGMLFAIGRPFPKGVILGRGPERDPTMFTPWLGIEHGFAPWPQDVRKNRIFIAESSGALDTEELPVSAQSAGYLATDEQDPSDDDADATYRPSQSDFSPPATAPNSQVTSAPSTENGHLQSSGTARSGQRMTRNAVISVKPSRAASAREAWSTPDSLCQHPPAGQEARTTRFSDVVDPSYLPSAKPQRPSHSSETVAGPQHQTLASRAPSIQGSSIMVSFEGPGGQVPRQRPWHMCQPGWKFDGHLCRAGVLDNEMDGRSISVSCIKDGHGIISREEYMQGDEEDWETVCRMVKRTAGKRNEGESLLVVVRRAEPVSDPDSIASFLYAD